MSVVQLIFTATPGPISWLIRARAGGPFSHVALVDGEHVVEAVAGKGVVRRTLAEALAGVSRWALMTVPHASPEEVLAAARSQLGRPYDWSGIAGVGVDRDWQEPDSWFCSELVAWAFEQAGTPLVRADAVSRVTPQNLWVLPHPVTLTAP
ncbi:permuted papain-like amidase YaeF/Yiix C92 family enzyme [Crenobacter luteus]|uniref:YiiX/YebB-like N1pC/P60 family cysteine hydrolase n=1 Tax=Crenobacter luteus TaxID=1452487 RepID=UPI00105366F5|nr:YiiX/YebB-like N1pC/P60 family cysteine hydrolase [Crenobacter luteus]TCP13774.1 permuted papain-like amidase YaeF/Yiix C92 family enzyme [Crenobacter luteus]